ncbi:MAG: hypothetical protein AAF649_09185 [Verrucomicrobiota bacterium]
MELRYRIMNEYVNHLRNHGKAPDSVIQLCNTLDINEKDFFSQFPSFPSVEKAFWADRLLEVIYSVTEGEEYQSFSAKQRFQTVIFAFLEKSLEYRSLMLIRFKGGPMKKNRELERFEKEFKSFCKEVLKHGRQSGEVAERGRLDALVPEGLYVTFRSAIEYHLHDESEGFERTDAYVEKSTTLAFDLIRTQAVDSAFDLARFLIPSPAQSS